MEETLRKAIERELEAINGRMLVLSTHISEYIASRRLDDAAINQIKLDILSLVYVRLSEILKKH